MIALVDPQAYPAGQPAHGAQHSTPEVVLASHRPPGVVTLSGHNASEASPVAHEPLGSPAAKGPQPGVWQLTFVAFLPSTQ